MKETPNPPQKERLSVSKTKRFLVYSKRYMTGKLVSHMYQHVGLESCQLRRRWVKIRVGPKIVTREDNIKCELHAI